MNAHLKHLLDGLASGSFRPDQKFTIMRSYLENGGGKRSEIPAEHLAWYDGMKKKVGATDARKMKIWATQRALRTPVQIKKDEEDDEAY